MTFPEGVSKPMRPQDKARMQKMKAFKEAKREAHKKQLKRLCIPVASWTQIGLANARAVRRRLIRQFNLPDDAAWTDIRKAFNLQLHPTLPKIPD